MAILNTSCCKAAKGVDAVVVVVVVMVVGVGAGDYDGLSNRALEWHL